MLFCRGAVCSLPCVTERGQAAAAPVSCPALLALACSLLMAGMRKPELTEPALPPDLALSLGQSSSPELGAFPHGSPNQGATEELCSGKEPGGGCVEGPCQSCSMRGKTRVPNNLRT